MEHDLAEILAKVLKEIDTPPPEDLTTLPKPRTDEAITVVVEE